MLWARRPTSLPLLGSTSGKSSKDWGVDSARAARFSIKAVATAGLAAFAIQGAHNRVCSWYQHTLEPLQAGKLVECLLFDHVVETILRQTHPFLISTRDRTKSLSRILANESSTLARSYKQRENPHLDKLVQWRL